MKFCTSLYVTCTHLFSLKKSLHTNAWGYACTVSEFLVGMDKQYIYLLLKKDIYILCKEFTQAPVQGVHKVSRQGSIRTRGKGL